MTQELISHQAESCLHPIYILTPRIWSLWSLSCLYSLPWVYRNLSLISKMPQTLGKGSSPFMEFFSQQTTPQNYILIFRWTEKELLSVDALLKSAHKFRGHYVLTFWRAHNCAYSQHKEGAPFIEGKYDRQIPASYTTLFCSRSNKEPVNTWLVWIKHIAFAK